MELRDLIMPLLILICLNTTIKCNKQHKVYKEYCIIKSIDVEEDNPIPNLIRKYHTTCGFSFHANINYNIGDTIQLNVIKILDEDTNKE